MSVSLGPGAASSLQIVSQQSHSMARLTVIIPIYNEARWIESVCNRLNEYATEFAMIYVDDGSSDNSFQLISIHASPSARCLSIGANGGKTSAVRAALECATTPYVIVHDADMEYDPADIHLLLNEAERSGDVIYGRRPSCWHRPRRWVFSIGVLSVDLALRAVYGRWVRDHATCYKLMRTELLRQLDLKSDGFDGCVEITAKLMRLGKPIRQVPISYKPRSAVEGKKLTLHYGLIAFQSVWRWRNWRPA